MRLVSACCFRFTAGLTLVCLAAVQALPAPVNPETKNTTVAPAEKLRKELDKVIDFEAPDQPFHLALKQLSDQTRINIVLDRVTLAQTNTDPETIIHVKLKETKVKTVLRTILSNLNLSHAIVGDIVYVSTDEMTMFRQMQQRVSMDLEKIEFATAMRQLSRETATNLIVDSRVTKEAAQKVSLLAEDVPLETAVRLMSEMVGLKPVRVGNVLFVCSKTNAQELRADPELMSRAAPGVNPNPDPNMIVLPGRPAAPMVVPAPAAPMPEEKKPEDKKDEKKPEEIKKPAEEKKPTEDKNN
jgi:hypothetical protein